MMYKHMDHDVLVGPEEALDRILAAMGKILLLKTSCPQLGSETKFLGRLLIKTELGFQVKLVAKFFVGLENRNPVHSPGVVRTTPQRTRFRDVQHARIMATV